MAVDKKKIGALIKQKSKKQSPPQKKAGGGREMPPEPDEDEDDEEDTKPDGGQHPKKGKGGDGGGGDHDEQPGEQDPDHDHEAGEGDHDEDEEVAHQQNERLKDGEGDQHLLQLASGVDPDHNPPEWVDDEDIWERAKAAADKVEDPDDYYALVTHIYEAMGGSVSGGGEE